VPTTPYLIPAKYVMRITYGGRFRIAQEKRSPDLGIFGPEYLAPDAALPINQIRDIIAGLQLQPGVPEPLLYNNYVRDVSERFEQALARIKTEYNFEYGPEFEIAICKTLRAVLPQKYGICRGYVVSELGGQLGTTSSSTIGCGSRRYGRWTQTTSRRKSRFRSKPCTPTSRPSTRFA
jgi:hypothetical protein